MGCEAYSVDHKKKSVKMQTSHTSQMSFTSFPNADMIDRTQPMYLV